MLACCAEEDVWWHTRELKSALEQLGWNNKSQKEEFTQLIGLKSATCHRWDGAHVLTRGREERSMMRVQEKRLFVYVNSPWMLMYIWIRSWHGSGLQVHLVTRHTKRYLSFHCRARSIIAKCGRWLSFLSLSPWPFRSDHLKIVFVYESYSKPKSSKNCDWLARRRWSQMLFVISRFWVNFEFPFRSITSF